MAMGGGGVPRQPPTNIAENADTIQEGKEAGGWGDPPP